MKNRRPVNLQKDQAVTINAGGGCVLTVTRSASGEDQAVTINAGRGCVLEVIRYQSGAVELRNAQSGAMLREWSPKEAKTP